MNDVITMQECLGNPETIVRMCALLHMCPHAVSVRNPQYSHKVAEHAETMHDQHTLMDLLVSSLAASSRRNSLSDRRPSPSLSCVATVAATICAARRLSGGLLQAVLTTHPHHFPAAWIGRCKW